MSLGQNAKAWTFSDSLYLAVILVVLIIGGTVGLIGYGLSTAFFHAPSTTSVTLFKATMLGWSNSTTVENHNFTQAIRNITIDLSITVPTNEVDVRVYFFDHSYLSHSFALILPFPIRGLSGSNQGSTAGNITSYRPVNITDSSSVIEFAWKDYHNQTGWIENKVLLKTRAVGDLVSGSRGQYNFYLPLGIFPPQTVLQDATKVSPPGVEFSTARGYGVNATAVIPAGSKLEELVPSTAIQGKAGNGVSGDEYDWTFTFPQVASSVSIDYQNIKEAGNYESDLFTGGALIGVGASAFFGGVLETVRFAYDKSKNNNSLVS